MNKFGKDARQQEVDVDMDAIWAAIEPEVDALNNEEPRRKRFVFWIFLMGTLIAGGGWWLSSSRNTQQGDLTKMESPAELPTADHKDVKNTGLSEAMVPMGTATTAAFHQEEAAAELVVAPSTVVSDDAHRQKQPSSTEHQHSNTGEGITRKKVAVTPMLSSAPVLSLAKQIETTKNVTKDGLVTVPTLPNQIPLLTSKHFEILSNEQLIRMLADQRNGETHPTKNSGLKADKKLKFTVATSGGFSIISRSLATKNDAASLLLQQRNQYEIPLEAVHYGVTIGAQHTSGIRIAVGIQQVNINEQFDFNEMQITLDSIMGVKSLILSPAGDTIPVMGMIPRTTTIKNKVEIYNTYRLLEVPITVGYHYRLNNRWDAGAAAGVLVNLSLKTTGIIPDELVQEVNIETDQDAIFKPNVGLNYYLGLSIGHSFSDAVDLHFSPAVRFYSTDFSVADYGVAQRYVLIGGDLGLTYRF